MYELNYLYYSEQSLCPLIFSYSGLNQTFKKLNFLEGFLRPWQGNLCLKQATSLSLSPPSLTPPLPLSISFSLSLTNLVSLCNSYQQCIRTTWESSSLLWKKGKDRSCSESEHRNVKTYFSTKATFSPFCKTIYS